MADKIYYLKNPGFLKKEYAKLLDNICRFTKSSSLDENMSAGEIWLSDNYYLAVKEVKFALNELEHIDFLPFTSENIPVLSDFARKYLDENRLEINVGKIGDYAKEYERLNILTLSELAVLTVFLRLELCRLLSHACENPDKQDDDSFFKAIFTAFRVLASTRTEDIVLSSPTEEILNADPSGDYKLMDTTTKNSYRKRLYEKALNKNLTERETAQRLIDEATKKSCHIGELLFPAQKPSGKGDLYIFLQIAAAVLVSAAFSLLYFKTLYSFFILLLPVWEITKKIQDLIYYKSRKATPLFAMKLKSGIPVDKKTAIAFSALVVNENDVEKLMTNLEKLWFTNNDKNLCYGILADFKDSVNKKEKGDSRIKEALADGISDLEKRFSASFFCLLRERSYNSKEKKYMGRERKRGAVCELVNYIVEGNKTDCEIFGCEKLLRQVKYVIALDADTILPIDGAKELAGAMLHPLNKPRINKEKGIVEKGYGIIVPKIISGLSTSTKSAFARAFAGFGGTQTYNNTDYDLYFDIFGEGSFTGKGIFDVEAFYYTAAKKIPDNKILSHDLVEGFFLRAGYLGSVCLTDNFPVGVLSFFNRLHRWYRGDIQSLIFIFSKVKLDAGKTKTYVSFKNKYKLFDNIRRLLTPVAILIIMLFGKARLLFFILGLLSLFWGQLVTISDILLQNGKEALKIRYSSRTLPVLQSAALSCAYSFILLPYNAYISLSAVCVTLYRMLISKRNLLNWTTAAQADKKYKGGILEHFDKMAFSELIGLVLIIFGRPILMAGGLLFLLSPWLSWLMSKEASQEPPPISEKSREALIGYARDMYSYYAEFMNKENNFFPPDNFQEEPLFCLARRTSPTNIGLALLCHVGAYDMGFITKEQLFERIGLCMDSVAKAEKYRGHLFNWYDTETLKPLIPKYISTVDSGNFACCLSVLYSSIVSLEGSKELLSLIKKTEDEMDFSFLYNEKKNLLYIGSDCKGNTGDSLYDLFMSECRMTSYYLIARGVLPKKHWFSMGRLFTGEIGYFGLKSWTGTMFEYLMPNLFLPAVHGSLLFEATNFAIFSQKRRIRGKNTPYGISESGFYSFDRCLFYQYKAFGVSALGLKKDLDSELVISPYSTFLTLPLDANSALSNLELEKKSGFYGKYGFYEAADYTKSRINSEFAIVKSYMAHHIGMSLLAICNLIFNNRFQKRFMSDKRLGSFTELLEEKLPETVILYNNGVQSKIPDVIRKPLMSESDEISLTGEKGAILSNGTIGCLLTDSGCGFLKYKDVNVTRYRTDNIKYPLGVFAFLTDGGKDYSLTYAPFYDNSLDYKASLSEHRAVYYLNTKSFDSRLVTTQHKCLPAQIFEINIINKTSVRKKDSAAFYFEPTLARNSEEQSHPAFSSLFTCTSYDDRGFVLFTRRRRLESDNEIWMAAGLITKHSEVLYETMRENLLPRIDGIKKIDLSPQSFKGISPSPIDACLCVLTELDMPPHSRAKSTLLICCGKTKAEAAALFESLKEKGTSRLLLECLPLYARLPEKDQALVSKLLPSIYYPKTIYGSPLPKITEQAELWQYGISGDIPIISICVNGLDDIPLVKSAVRIFSHLSLQCVECDFAIIYYEDGDYQRTILNAIKTVVSSLDADSLTEKRGGIFIINEKEERRDLLLRLSVFVFNKDYENQKLTGRFTPFTLSKARDIPNREELYNQTQTGGFIDGGYKVTSKDFWSFRPPYCMVLANKSFGTLVSDSSLGYTYALNSRENKITPWSNDAVYDNSGEKLFLRIGGEIYDLCREGHAFIKPEEVIYNCVIKDIEINVRVYVHDVKCCKYIDVSFKNLTEEKKDLKICLYLEPVTGVAPKSNNSLINIVKEQNALCFNSTMENGFGGFAYLHLNEDGFFSNDRLMFLQGIWDSGVSSGVLPCCVRGTDFCLKEEKSLRFIIGYSKSIRGMENAVNEPYTKKEKEAFIKIKTPDNNLNILYNDFLTEQLLKARLYARTGFYQCGGAYGFRDQLQDAICASNLHPDILKIQIFRCSANQFEEGDVLHWWHEFFRKKLRKRSRGVRTRCSDDLLWLPYAVCEYVEKTGDFELLNKKISYLKDRQLDEDESESYLSPDYSEIKESVYHHCLRAIKKGCRFGQNGLSLFGSGDWNDGMNLVGANGKGTSVWLSMFLVLVLERFSKICAYKEDSENHDFCVRTSIALRAAIEKRAYDGQYYLRGFFDNGDPLSSKSSDECKIDILPQGFASLCGFDKKRVQSSLDFVSKQLVKDKFGVIALFTPPFDNSKNNPGYIKSYIPGIRENGGQYTHGALWYVLGLIKNGETDKAYELLKMINPLSHAMSNKEAKRFHTEPYSLCGDVYLAKGLEGRGGWSHYTGSAGWYLKIITEEIFGIQFINGSYEFKPNLPSSWDSFEATVQKDGKILIFKADKNNDGSWNVSQNNLTEENT